MLWGGERIASNLITFAVNVSLAPRIDAINSSENSRCLQSRQQISAIHYIQWTERVYLDDVWTNGRTHFCAAISDQEDPARN